MVGAIWNAEKARVPFAAEGKPHSKSRLEQRFDGFDDYVVDAVEIFGAIT